MSSQLSLNREDKADNSHHRPDPLGHNALLKNSKCDKRPTDSGKKVTDLTQQNGVVFHKAATLARPPQAVPTAGHGGRGGQPFSHRATWHEVERVGQAVRCRKPAMGLGRLRQSLRAYPIVVRISV